VRAPPLDPTDILVLEDLDDSLAPLIETLRSEGHRVDRATEEGSLRDAFLDAGGHAVLVIAPGVPEPLAIRASRSLRAVDPGLRVVALGAAHSGEGWPTYGLTRLSSHHPAAPQTMAALRRVLTVLQS
jgi:DNA-binding NtrC family response regulator